jgi:hypothetical protein
MKYVLMCIVMLACFAFGGVSSTNPPVDEADELSATTCGGTVCGKGTFCCNPSCGTCVPKGMECTQQSCN